MELERYRFLQTELIRLHKVLTEYTFSVILPLSSFLTLRQLDKVKDNPPITGFESLEIPVERPYTIEHILKAVDIMGDELQIGFRYPRKDIPVIYTSIQDWIRYWIEIKRDWGYLRTPDIGELELIERLAKHIFSYYAHYYYENVNKILHVNSNEELTLLDVLKGRMMFGDAMDNGISFISYVDEYKSDTGIRGKSNSGIDFLGGFGGGL